MFRNRELKVTMEKAGKKQQDECACDVQRVKIEEPFEDKLIKAKVIVEDVAKKAFIGFCAYIVLDTARQVAIERSKRTFDE